MNRFLGNITVFDFETSGTDPVNDRVIEIAAIRCVNGEIVTQFQTLVQFQGILQPKITEITGIHHEELIGGLSEEIAFKILRNMMKDSVLVAHNAAFDLAFLHYWMQRTGGRTFDNPFIDTCTIARSRHTYPHKLTDMTARYGINLIGAHRALNDVIGCWELLKAMEREESTQFFINRLGFVRKYGPPTWSPDYAELEPIDLKFN